MRIPLGKEVVIRKISSLPPEVNIPVKSPLLRMMLSLAGRLPLATSQSAPSQIGAGQGSTEVLRRCGSGCAHE